jgi:hypothetical protein
MSDPEVPEPQEVIVPERKDKLTTKRGLDIPKIEEVMGREQERDLSLIYRADQLQLFIECPEQGRRFHFQRKPSDPPLIQAAWEAHKNYLNYRDTDDAKTTLAWYKALVDIISQVQQLRREAMDRMLQWKKQAEDRGEGLGYMSDEDLEKVANG